ncbi:MAG: hypothetical protein AAF806_26445 [Bacteroidota bacterium]
MNSVFDELIEFLAELDPAKMIAFRSSAVIQQRTEELLAKNKTDGLTDEEIKEMEQLMLLEHIVSIAKAKAMKKLAINNNSPNTSFRERTAEAMIRLAKQQPVTLKEARKQVEWLNRNSKTKHNKRRN